MNDGNGVMSLSNTPNEPRYNGNGDRIFRGFTPEGEVFGIEVVDIPTAEPATDREEQGYGEWIDLLESQVYVNGGSRVHRDFSSQSGVQSFSATLKNAQTALWRTFRI